MKKYVIGALLIIAATGFLAYANTLKGPFVWDDSFLIKDNVRIKRLADAPKMIAEDIGKGVGKSYASYRPLQILTYALDYRAWKLNPLGYHLTNIVLHIAASLVLFWLVMVLCKDLFLAFWAALFFVVHPVHTEAVAYIAGRADPLSLVFMLLAFIFYIKFAEAGNMWHLLVAVACYLPALFARETALILVPLLLVYHTAFKKRINIDGIFAMVTAALLYVLARVLVMRFAMIDVHTTFAQRLPGFFAAFAQYLRLLVLPVGLHMEYGEKIFAWNNAFAVMGIALSVAMVFSLWDALRRKNTLMAFGIAWFLVALLAQSNLYPLNAYMAEHWLYIPSIGFCIIVAWGLSIVRSRYSKKAALVCGALIVFCLGALTIGQNRYWQDPVRLYQRTIQLVPDSSKAYTNLGAELREQGRNDEAIVTLKHVLLLNPESAIAYNNLGINYLDLQRNEEAAVVFQKAIELDNQYAKAYSNLAFAYHNLGRDAEAAEVLMKSIRFNPLLPEPYNNLGALYYSAGDIQRSQALFSKAISLDPHYFDAYKNLGNAERMLGNTQEAEAAYRHALVLRPDSQEILASLSMTLAQAGKIDEAIAGLNALIARYPPQPKYYSNLGVLYSNKGLQDKALEAFQNAVALDPSFAEGYNNLGAAALAQGKTDEAIAAFQKAVALKPSYGAAHMNLAAALYQKNDFQAAREHFNSAVALGEKNPSLEEKLKAVAQQ